MAIAIGHQLELGRDAGGERWFLDGEAIHCGQSLELWCEEIQLPYAFDVAREIWLPVRFESVQREWGPQPVFFVWLGETLGNVKLVDLCYLEARFRWPDGS